MTDINNPSNTHIEIKTQEGLLRLRQIHGAEELQRYLSQQSEESLVLYTTQYNSQFGLKFVPQLQTVFYFQLHRALIMPADQVDLLRERFTQIYDIGQAVKRMQFDRASGEFNTRNYSAEDVFNVLTKSNEALLAMIKAGAYQPGTIFGKQPASPLPKSSRDLKEPSPIIDPQRKR